jgi:TP901 family phage tail tape measure protein
MSGNLFTGLGAGLNNVGNQIKMIGNNIAQLGFAWSTTFGILAVAGLSAMVRAGMEYEQTLQNIRHLTNSSEEEMNAWAQKLLELGPKLGKMPQELAESLYFIKSVDLRGVTNQLEVLEATAMASAIGMGQMEPITKSVVSILEVYGDTGLTATEATNGLLVSIRLAAFEADGLTRSFARALPFAKAAGISFGEAAGFLAMYSRDGASAEMATTALINTLNFVVDPTQEAKDTLEEYGWSIQSVRDSIAGPNGLNGTLVVLAETMGTDIARLFTTRATSGVLAVTDQADEYRRIVQEIEAATDLAVGEISELEEAFLDYSKGVNFAWNATKAGFQALAIQGFQAIKAPLAAVLLQLRDFLDVIREIVYNNPMLAEMALRFILISAAMGPALIILGAFIRSIGNVMTLLAVPLRFVGYMLQIVQTNALGLFILFHGVGKAAVRGLQTGLLNSMMVMRMFVRQLWVTRNAVFALTASFLHLNTLSRRLISANIAFPFVMLGGSIIRANRLFVLLMTTISRGAFRFAAFVSAFNATALIAKVTAVRTAFTGLVSSVVASRFVAIWVGAFNTISMAVSGLVARIAFLFPALGAQLSRMGFMLTLRLVMPVRAAVAAVVSAFNILPMAFGLVLAAVHGVLWAMDRAIMAVLSRIAMNMSITMLKLWDAVFFALTNIAGALITAVSQTVGLVLTSMFSAIMAMIPTVISAAAAAVGAITSIAGAIAAIAAPVVAVGAAIAGGILLIASAAGAVKKTFTRVRSDLNRIAPTIGGDMRGHGRNIIEQFAQGMLDGLIAVVQALRYIGRVIKSWLQPGSPPKLLPDLTIWGSGAMSAYMEGWSEFDFSAFSEISDKFRQFFTSLLPADATALDEANVIGSLIEFRDLMASAFNEIDAVGMVSDTIWASINAGLQGASQEMQNYVRLTLMAAEAQERVKEIQEQINAVQAQFSEQLAPIDKRLAEIADIRQEAVDDDRIKELERIIADPRASERAKMLAALEIEEIGLQADKAEIEEERDLQLEALQAQLDLAQSEYEQIAYQAQLAEEMLALQIEQNELMREWAKALQEAEEEAAAAEEEAAAGEGEFVGGAFPEVGEPPDLGDLGDLEGLDFGDPTRALDTKLQELREELGGLASDVAGIGQLIWERMNDLWNSRLKPIWDGIINHPFVQEIWQTLQDTVGNTIDRFNEMKPSLDGVSQAMDSLRPLAYTLGLIVVSLVNAFGNLITNLGGIFGSILTRLTELAPSIDQTFGGIRDIISGVMRMINGDVEGGFEELKGGIQQALFGVLSFIGTLFAGIVDIGIRILASVADFVLTFVDRILQGIQEATGINTEKLRAWIEEAKLWLQELLTNTDNIGLLLWQKMVEIWNSIVESVRTKWEEIRLAIAEKVEAIRAAIAEKVELIKAPFVSLAERVTEFATKVGETRDRVVTSMEEMKAGVDEKFASIREFIQYLVDRFQYMRDRIQAFKDLVIGDMTILAQRLLDKFIEITGGIDKWQIRIDTFRRGFEVFKTLINLYMENVRDRFSILIEAIIGFFKDLAERVEVHVLASFRKFKAEAILVFNAFKEIIIDRIQLVIDIFTALEEFVKGALTKAISDFKEYAVGWIQTVKAQIVGNVEAMIGAFNSFMGTIEGIYNWLRTHVFRIQTEGDLPSVGGSGGGGGGNAPPGGYPQAARGGFFRKGKPVWVGEEGIELFVPHDNGSVVPNNRLEKLMRSLYIMRPEGAMMIGNSAPMISFGDTYIDNSLDAIKLEARIRSVVIRMMDRQR